MKLQQLDVGQGIRRTIGFSKRKKKKNNECKTHDRNPLQNRVKLHRY